MLEGYAGFGALSVLAATRPNVTQRPASVTLIEGNRAAAILARLHLRMHGIEGQGRCLLGAVEERLPELEPDAVDSIVVDPPRAGLAPEVPAEVARLRPRRLVYVSCDPATLARDLTRLASLGFKVETQTLVDMFPQTYHIETVTLLEPAR